MNTARRVMLDRIAAALADRPSPAPITRAYRTAGSVAVADMPALLTDRLVDYRALVRRCTAGDLTATISAALADRGARRVVVAADLPAALRPDGVEVLPDAPPLPLGTLDAVDAVLTTCAVAVAETGTVVLDGGPGQGRRAISLVPDYHLLVVRVDQVVAAVPDAVAALDPTRPQTWISGPSATSDIELSRVEGVHGPRTLEVVLVG